MYWGVSQVNVWDRDTLDTGEGRGGTEGDSGDLERGLGDLESVDRGGASRHFRDSRRFPGRTSVTNSTLVLRTDKEDPPTRKIRTPTLRRPTSLGTRNL